MSKSKLIKLKKLDAKTSPADAGLSHTDRPIAALASGQGAAAVSIIRISGACTFSMLAPFFPKRDEFPEREMTLSSFVDPETGDVVDELMLALFAGPRSFTGEDSAELFCHGGPYIVNRILKSLFQHGCRPAEPGEFTKRAFLNGKVDLTAAEGIRELVEAGSHQQWLAARQLATGRLGQVIEQLRIEIIGAMAYLEARIDFPDEGDTQGVALDHVSDRVKQVLTRVEALQNSYDSGRVASSGLMVTIIGAPNMGKSSLMNALLDKERAIVTDIAGTTRDYLEERCLVKGRLIRLVDTAGIRSTEEVVEKIGVGAAVKLAHEADLVIILTAANASQDELTYFQEAIAAVPTEKCIPVINKIDQVSNDFDFEDKALKISCKTGDGIELLRSDIAARVDGFVGNLKEEPFITSARHATALEDCKSFLLRFFSGIEDGLYEEMLAFELQHAIRALSSIIGDVEHDDLLDRIFSEFCVGK
ncbi:tRNA uridine-5-carboxymethylaminomethyl(34) synthesis GTPase MnmE [Pseudobacteriovorax antillogorgiicola]|uniref:tRNA modification GTPase MnmE n=1 Tax=Pseudobacteriovorax antillogorgiicola TaxID=1513793 RepID=A0A1Y6CHY2_9BACT|nr:tRNA uridine-5-carboxymethylaminomethyl(34) synthesis GTPase MnmE [Pseudobacteriovorax antillogorgiicola]TCS46680.1 tRNA modification GTPase [Pseudobacteriovorax antillogorgiicola]SMF66691.1 tRNA modification GTPase [Pseudobacteriovorax antillogorgiicola]